MGSSETPLLTDYVLGFRSWHVDENGLLLPHSRREAWRPGTNRAECRVGKRASKAAHDAPDADCMCGLYAHYTPAMNSHYGVGVTSVQGAVVGWGRMMVHPDGWRAEYARIVVLIYRPTDFFDTVPVEVRRAAKRYGVPVMRPKAAARYALEHGKPVPRSLRPKETHEDVIRQLKRHHRLQRRQRALLWKTARKA